MRQTRIDWKDPDILKKLEQLAAQGLSDEQIAQVFGVSRSTIARNKKNNATFETAIKNGAAKGIATITNALFVSAKNGNLGAQIFYLKNKAGWSEKQELAVAGEGITLNINYGNGNQLPS